MDIELLVLNMQQSKCFHLLRVLFFFFYYMTGRLCEVRKESHWQSRSQLGQCWPTVRKITSINTQRPALNNKTSDWKVFLRPIRVLWLIFPDVCLLIVRHLWASQWAPCLFGWHYSSCRPRSMDFFFFFCLTHPFILQQRCTTVNRAVYWGDIWKSSCFDFFHSCVTLLPSSQSSTKSNFSI